MYSTYVYIQPDTCHAAVAVGEEGVPRAQALPEYIYSLTRVTPLWQLEKKAFLAHKHCQTLMDLRWRGGHPRSSVTIYI